MIFGYAWYIWGIGIVFVAGGIVWHLERKRIGAAVSGWVQHHLSLTEQASLSAIYQVLRPYASDVVKMVIHDVPGAAEAEVLAQAVSHLLAMPLFAKLDRTVITPVVQGVLADLHPSAPSVPAK